MAESQTQKVIRNALEVLQLYPNGIRYSELRRKVLEKIPEVPSNTIHGVIWNLNTRSSSVVKPERGLYILDKHASLDQKVKGAAHEIAATVAKKVSDSLSRVEEKPFYKPFAAYLVEDLDEATRAEPLGGHYFEEKWGTPDVFGIYKFSDTDPIRPVTEIVTAEIKTDSKALVTAFGQACAYKAFSHKVYLVVPRDAESDISRVESLCLRFGIGLILFDKTNSSDPKFSIRTRAVRNEPDYFYTNLYIQKLPSDIKNRLFG